MDNKLQEHASFYSEKKETLNVFTILRGTGRTETGSDVMTSAIYISDKAKCI